MFFGSYAFPELDSLIIGNNVQGASLHEVCPVGDVNGDTIDDFATAWDSTGMLWFGSSNMDTVWDVNMGLDYFGYQATFPYFMHGDFNNDGYGDIVGTDSRYAYWDGRAGIWLGGQQFNGTVDLTLYGTYHNCMQFGWGKAAGDFNGDGFCDLAISSPFFDGVITMNPGFIYVYSGNAELIDTTVANEDEQIPVPQSDEWDLNVFPNPFILGDNVHIDFTGAGYKQQQGVTINIYNLKGQMVAGLTDINPANSYQIPTGIMSRLGTGIYLLSVQQGGKPICTKKICVF